MMNVTVYN